MANNMLKHGDQFDYPNATGSGILSGAVVAMGDLVGIALVDILDGSTGAIQVAGVAEIAKQTSQAWTIGAKLYWDATNGVFTTSADDGGTPTPVSFLWAGWCYKAADSSAATGFIKLKVS